MAKFEPKTFWLRNGTREVVMIEQVTHRTIILASGESHPKSEFAEAFMSAIPAVGSQWMPDAEYAATLPEDQRREFPVTLFDGVVHLGNGQSFDIEEFHLRFVPAPPVAPIVENAPENTTAVDHSESGLPEIMPIQNAEPERPRATQWPEVVETRTLQVQIPEIEIREKAARMGELHMKLNQLSAVRKAYKTELDDLSDQCRRGTKDTPVRCQWIFERHGNVVDPTRKTLVRLDTGDVVATAPMTIEDRQMTLDIDLGTAGYANKQEEEYPMGDDPFAGDEDAGDDPDLSHAPAMPEDGSKTFVVTPMPLPAPIIAPSQFAGGEGVRM